MIGKITVFFIWLQPGTCSCMCWSTWLGSKLQDIKKADSIEERRDGRFKLIVLLLIVIAPGLAIPHRQFN